MQKQFSKIEFLIIIVKNNYFKYAIFSFFISINIYSQTANILSKDSLKEKTLITLRQVFWDNLPKATKWTNDYEDLYSDAEQVKLDSIISKFESETTCEIAIVTIDTIKTSENKFEDLSLHIAKTWGVGKQNIDNGILIAISKGYRKIRIQNGNGIEKIIQARMSVPERTAFKEAYDAIREQAITNADAEAIKEFHLQFSRNKDGGSQVEEANEKNNG